MSTDRFIVTGRRLCTLFPHLTLAVVLVGCQPTATLRPTEAPRATPTAEQRVERYIEVYGGLAGVYRSILDESRCDRLQEQLYTATDNGTLGYQVALKDRASEIRCPELRFTRP